MENLQQILDRFLEFLQYFRDMIGGLWELIGDNTAPIGLVISFLTLLVGIPRIKRWLGEGKQQDTPQPHADRDREVMLRKIKTYWVKPLESNLYQEARVELKLTEPKRAVLTRIHRYNQTGGEAGPEVPRHKPIEEIFDEAAEQLLILGEPGTGKSTKLIGLAKALLDRADNDPSKPIPVILNLSSWTEWTKKAKQAALGEWIQFELVKRYRAPSAGAKQWVKDDEIVPLLDGLDEVAAEQRAACVAAINTYRRDGGFQPMAVCCRLEEYRKLPARLDLEGAITVEPLRRDEVDSYLDKHGSKLQRVREALRDDPELWNLMTTPLMLTVLFIASGGVEGNETRSEPDRPAGSTCALSAQCLTNAGPGGSLRMMQRAGRGRSSSSE